MVLKFRYGGKGGEERRLQVSNNMLAVRKERRSPSGQHRIIGEGAAGA